MKATKTGGIQKMINIDITDYQFKHGKKPRGFGYWSFVPADMYWPFKMPEGAVLDTFGYYSDVKADLRHDYPEIVDWKLLP